MGIFHFNLEVVNENSQTIWSMRNDGTQQQGALTNSKILYGILKFG